MKIIMTQGHKKGFTLIELLVVIAIVAILAVVVILTLNPAEILKQARDSNRISDLNTVKSAISVYLADVASPSIGSAGWCYLTATTTGMNNFVNCGFAGTYTNSTSSNSVAVDGSGWIPVNFDQISSGSPLGTLPRDPLNVAPYVYRYVASTTATSFKLMAPLESNKYTTGAGSSTVVNDGGTSSTAYEAGTSLGL